MAQGFARKEIFDGSVFIKDGANLDAFSRLRVSNPLNVFNNQFTYDLSPLIFEQIINGAGSVTHSLSDRIAELNLTTPSFGDYVYMQSYEYIPYQPGRSQLVFITFNMFPNGIIANDVIKEVGLGDASDGFFFQSNAATGLTQFLIFSTSGLATQVATQPSWNIDRLDGTGPSGITLNLTYTQILVIDFQALYVGRVRFGFDIGGQIVYAHEFNHANLVQFPYIATANLPIRVGMYSNDIATDKMDFICCSVASEGGLEDAQRFGYNFSLDGSYTTLPTASTYVTSLRPALTFNSITNRVKIVLDEIEFLNDGNSPIYWQLGIGATIGTPTYAPYNATYSAVDYDTAGTGTASPAIIIDSGFIPSGGGSKSATAARQLQSKYPITLDASGVPRDLGTISLFAESVGSASDLYYTIKWKEIR